MMNVGDQNGLEAWRLVVRSEQPVSGSNRIAAMQSILQFKFSPGLVKTYHAIFGEAISDSMTKAVIKSQMPADLRAHLELQTFARTTDLFNLMASLSKMRTAATSSSSAGHGPTAMDIGWVKSKGQGKSKNKENGKGKKARAKERAKKNPRARSSRDGVTTADNGVTKLQSVGIENRCTKYKVKLVRPARAVRSLHCRPQM